MLVIAKQGRYLRRFSTARALAASSAKTLQELRLRDSKSFQRLVRRGVFVETTPGRYYLELGRAAAFKRHRRTQALFVLGFPLIIASIATAVTLFVAPQN
jgi:hypothetical protein